MKPQFSKKRIDQLLQSRDNLVEGETIKGIMRHGDKGAEIVCPCCVSMRVTPYGVSHEQVESMAKKLCKI